jgi:lysozyme
MNIGQKGLHLIKEFEGFYPRPYKDPVGIWTIGYGTIKYPDGRSVQPNDPPIDEKTAETFLLAEIRGIENFLNNNLKVNLNQNQFDALCSFAYNLGINALKNSTLFKLVNQNPNDPNIRNEFLKWDKGRINGELKVIPGLYKRRVAESNLYFGNEFLF